MPNIHFSFRRGAGDVPEILYGKVEIKPTLAFARGTSLVLPAPTTLDLVNGEATANNVYPTPAPVEGQVEWAYRVKAIDTRGQSFEWMVGVPDSTGTVEFTALPRYFETKPPLFGKGDKGDPGEAATIQIGTTTSGTTPSVTNSGTNQAAILNFVLPKGDKGDRGDGVPTGGTALQYLRKDSAGANTEWATLDKGAVGLSNVDNTSDAEKPVSTATQDALDSLEQGTDARVAGIVNNSTSATYGNLRNLFVSKDSSIVSVKDTGAVGDGIADDTVALQTAFNSSAIVFLPVGTYLVSSTLYVPSNTTVFGAGIGRSVIRMSEGVLSNLNVITNAKNDQLPRTSYDTAIVLRDFSVDGRGSTRTSAPGLAGSYGSCVAFSTVQNVFVERVHAYNAYLHCFDVAASVYSKDSDGPNVWPIGPSRDVVYSDCLAGDALQDDGFTTHGSFNIVFDNCKAIRTSNPTNYSSQGFEVDEGSYEVKLLNCYSYGWAKGFQVKGHTLTPPAYNVELTSCIAEACSMGYDIATGLSENAGVARNVYLNNCEARNLVEAHSTYKDLKAIQISGYDNVVVKNFLSVNTPSAGGITVGDGTKNIIIDGFRGENISTAATNTSRGIIHFYGSAGENNTIRDVNISGAVSIPVILNNSSADFFTVDGVRAVGSNQQMYCVSDSYYSGNHNISRVFSAGFKADIVVRNGSGAGEFKQQSVYLNSQQAFLNTALYHKTDKGPWIRWGEGSPEGVLSGPIGSMYLRTDGGVSTTLYIKQTGTSNTGWQAK